MTEPRQKTRLEQLEDRISEIEGAIGTIASSIDELKKVGVGKPTGLFGGKRERTAMKDTQTGKIYVSKAALGKNLAVEADTTGLDHFAYYKLVAKFPDRFVIASAEEADKVWAEEKARIEAEVEAENKRLAAEADVKAKAEKGKS